MQRIKVSKYFHLDEFVDPFTYFNEKDNGLSKIDKRLFDLADKLRELKGTPLYINTWWGYYIGHLHRLALPKTDKLSLTMQKLVLEIESSNFSKWSGLRTSRCKIGAAKSAHKLGKAIDPKGSGKELFALVKKNAKVFYDLGLRRMEDTSITPTWLHMDTHELNTTPGTIRVVDLKKVTQIIKL